ncbi:nucleotide sugar dehydrogenase [Nonomuraea insulae]|uniref:Nucleotide sugar dehydrogenase n=1 Tax=Nonomuraea insulae TaxID=1616787 RepID=A0ABW1D8R4_9ACTN
MQVAVIGLGYVGLPLALMLARHHTVIGVDTNEALRMAVERGEPPFHEPGLDRLFESLPPGALTVAPSLAGTRPDAVLICVGTPVRSDSHGPDLTQLEAAVTEAARVSSDTLVIVRSTVPIGTCRHVVLPILARAAASPLLAFCPERTIQGMALRELVSLPQIIGGLDERSADRAKRLLEPVAPDQLTVSSLEAAEAIKLICNAHTDLIYGFGNEVALLADRLGLDAYELISSANLRYPRPDLCRPGYVGGSCLSKDPYLLLHSARAAGHTLPLVTAARQVNERLPAYAAERVLTALEERGTAPADAKVLVAGIAYKGRPQTDDVRGAASTALSQALRHRVSALYGHDFMVPRTTIAEMGLTPVGLEEGLRDADALILLTDHPGYAELDAARLVSLMRPSPVVFDMWASLHPRLSDEAGLRYIGLGCG